MTRHYFYYLLKNSTKLYFFTQEMILQFHVEPERGSPEINIHSNQNISFQRLFLSFVV